MSKTLSLAAVLMTLGMGAAFAADMTNGHPAGASQAAATTTMAAGDATAHASSYPIAMPRATVWVYGQFAPSGTTEGGQN